MAAKTKSSRTRATLKRDVMMALGMLSLSLRGPAATGTIADVRHVVIMMQENRSFDHYFGTMRGVRGYGDRTMLTFPSGYSACHQPYESAFLLPFHTSEQLLNDVGHGWNGLHGTWNFGKWDCWVTVNGTSSMVYHNRDDLPFYHALAEAYTICDAHYCSVLGPTIPNRLYFYTGMIGRNSPGDGLTTTGPIPAEGFNWTTYPERLEAAGVSWKLYRPPGDWIGDTLAFFVQFTNASPGTPLYERGMATVPDVVAAFRHDVTNGTLPRVSWVLTPLEITEHPPWSPANGQIFVKQVLDAIALNPDVYNSTVFILTYDENGGFFDHLPPPVPPPGTPDEFENGLPIGLGARVPLILVSPWSRGGYVCSQVFDLTSVIRFLEQWTGVVEPNISAWRRQLCGDLTSAFDFAHPDTSRPVLADLAPVYGWGVIPEVPAVQTPPRQETGTRRSRPLPYQPNLSSHADYENSRLLITLTNSGTAAVHLAIYANAHRTDGPWQYDVSPGGAATGSFAVNTNFGGAYDLTCYGPNGFLRGLAGSIHSNGPPCEVLSRIDPVAGSLTLTLHNPTATPAVFTVADDYALGGPWKFSVAPASTCTHTFVAEIIREGWYDLTARVDLDPGFLRRLAGHIETGAVTRYGIDTPPALSVAVLPGELHLKYPGVLSGRILESSTNLAPDSWAPVGITPAKDIHSNNVVTLPPAAKSMFFRLRP